MGKTQIDHLEITTYSGVTQDKVVFCANVETMIDEGHGLSSFTDQASGYAKGQGEAQ